MTGDLGEGRVALVRWVAHCFRFILWFDSLLFSPSGPAGTGKTESVKALGHQLGRFVLVFNCDETFDFQVRIS